MLQPLWWSPWVSMQAQLSISLLCSGKKQRAGAGGCSDTRAARPGLVSLLPFIDPQPSAQRRREGRAAPSPSWLGRAGGWARTQVMRLMDAFSSLALGAALAWCPWALWSRHRSWLLCKHLPVTPELWWAPRPPRAAAGSGSASWGASGQPAPSGASCCLLGSSRHFVVAAQTWSLAGVAVCSLGPFQGAAVKMPAERERGSLCSRPARA